MLTAFWLSLEGNKRFSKLYINELKVISKLELIQCPFKKYIQAYSCSRNISDTCRSDFNNLILLVFMLSFDLLLSQSSKISINL